MSHDIIKVEELGKKYRIRHQQAGSYVALRDVIVDKARRTARRAMALARKPAARAAADAQRGAGPVVEDFWALWDVSFSVKEGEVVGVIGRNGAGKSTLLKILSRITEPTRGRVTLDGRVASLLEVGTGFHPELTGRENIFLNGAILGMTKIEMRRKFDEIVEFAEVERFLDTPVKRYSSGMYVRLAFAVAAHLDSEILIVDEVLAVGDARFQQKCLGRMQSVGAAGRTVLVVSHNMATVNSLCNRALWLANGVVKMEGDVQRVVSEYLLQDAAGIGSVDLTTYRQDRRLSFTHLSLMDRSGQVRSVFDVRDPIVIEISYEAQEHVVGTEVTLRIYNSGGVPIFSTNRSASRGLNIALGVHLAHLTIPGPLLAPGSYTIDLGIHVPNVEVWAHLQSVASFTVEETGSEMSAYAGQSHGVVLLDLDWQEAGTDSHAPDPLLRGA